MQSHVQTRTLTDALAKAAEILRTRNTSFVASAEHAALDELFARSPRGEAFRSWAFLAAEYDQAVRQVQECAPALAASLERPSHPNDFVVVGHCSLDVRFPAEPNGAEAIELEVLGGETVKGAEVTARSAHLFRDGTVAFPIDTGGVVYLHQPTEEPNSSAAQLAYDVWSKLGKPRSAGLTVQFPAARTTNVPEYPWVTRLVSTCDLYFVKKHLCQGEAHVDHNGFFASETQVVQVAWRSVPPKLQKVVINGPFLVFFADSDGVHAAAWFGQDSFAATRPRTEWWLMDCDLPNLRWARLTVHEDGTVELLTCDGSQAFASVEAAEDELRQDEYDRLSDIVEDYEYYEGEHPGVPLRALRPPTATAPDELRLLMYQEWDPELGRWRPRGRS